MKRKAVLKILLLTFVVAMVLMNATSAYAEDLPQPFKSFASDSRWCAGIAWTSGQTPKLSSFSGVGCCAYCADFTQYCFGISNPRGGEVFYDTSEIRAGDVLTVGNQSNGYGHWFVCLMRSGNSLYVAEGNYGNKVRIGWNYSIKNSKRFNEASDTFTAGYHFMDDVPPVVNVARIQNRTSEGYDVVVEATDNIGVSRIQIGTWHSRMNIDNAVWNEAVPNQNGRAEFHVSYNQFSNTTGAEFYTNAYAWDAAGNVSTAVRCYTIEDLGDDFYATIIWDSSGGFWENDGNRIKISDSSDYAFDTDPKHIWHFVKQKGGSYKGSYEITCENNGRCVDIDSYKTEDGTSVNLLERATNAAQRFYICVNTDKEYPRYFFRSVYCNGALDVDAGGTKAIRLWHVNGMGTQFFQINNLSDSEYSYPGRVPPQAPTIRAEFKGQSATLFWNSPVSGPFDERAYHIVLYSGNTAGGTILTEIADTDEESHSFSLTPGDYTVKVTAQNTKYTGLSSEQSFSFSVTNEYTIRYNANGGDDISGIPSAQTKTAGTPITLSNVVPTRADGHSGGYMVNFSGNGGITSSEWNIVSVSAKYSFKNWNTAADGSGSVYLPGAQYSNDADLVLFAQWEKLSETPEPIILPTAVYDGHIFLGWSTDPDAVIADYRAGDSFICDRNLWLYAIWRSNPEHLFVVPRALTVIGDQAFLGTNADAIFIPATVTSIGTDAFGDVAIYGFTGTVAEDYAAENGLPFIPVTDGLVS